MIYAAAKMKDDKSMTLALNWLMFFILGTCIEFIFPAQPGQTWRYRWVNVCYAAIYCAVIFLTAPTLYIGVAALSKWLPAQLFDLTKLIGDGAGWQIAAGFLIYAITDFFYYWWHRAQHTFPVLWAQHAVHHSEENLNVTTSTRHHWSEFMFQAFVIGVPMAVLFKTPVLTIWAVATTFAAWSFFIHTNIRLQLGWLSWLICGPQLHRLHHSKLPQHKDRNFAAYFPIWDVLFGTYTAPQRGEFPPTGLHDGTRINNVSDLAVRPFVTWWRMLTNR